MIPLKSLRGLVEVRDVLGGLGEMKELNSKNPGARNRCLMPTQVTSEADTSLAERRPQQDRHFDHSLVRPWQTTQ